MVKKGRPTIDGDRRRDTQIVVLLSKEEKRQLQEWAKTQPVGLGPIARALLFAAMETAKRDENSRR